MSESRNYYVSGDSPPYEEIVPVYQAAFAGEPWREVSKCPDDRQRCQSGLSAVAVGSTCEVCMKIPSQPAYLVEELTEKFMEISESRPTVWYTETVRDGSMALAALAWRASPGRIAKEKYPGSSRMRAWMNNALGDDEIMWLDEVFADSTIRPRGNLQKFGEFTRALAGDLECSTIAYRTINPAILQTARRDFDDQAQIFAGQRRGQPCGDDIVAGTAPDWRDFVVINLNRENKR